MATCNRCGKTDLVWIKERYGPRLIDANFDYHFCKKPKDPSAVNSWPPKPTAIIRKAEVTAAIAQDTSTKVPWEK